MKYTLEEINQLEQKINKCFNTGVFRTEKQTTKDLVVITVYHNKQVITNFVFMISPVKELKTKTFNVNVPKGKLPKSMIDQILKDSKEDKIT